MDDALLKAVVLAAADHASQRRPASREVGHQGLEVAGTITLGSGVFDQLSQRSAGKRRIATSRNGAWTGFIMPLPSKKLR